MLIFSILYVGGEKSAIIMILFMVYFGYILFSKYVHNKESNKEAGEKVISESSENEEKNEASNKWSSQLKLLSNTKDYLEFITDIFKESKKDLREGRYFKFVIGRVGVFLLFLSLSFGVARAIYVEENIHVRINNTPNIYSLYMTTSSGVGLYDKTNKVALFSSWDSININCFISIRMI